MTLSVSDRVTHRLPRPIKCDECGSPRVHLQKRSLMRMRSPKAWDLVWHCQDCLALVGCHEGTAIPLGFMAGSETRHARFTVHQSFDKMWKGRARMSRAEAYAWMARVLAIPVERAHIGMLNSEQCAALETAVANYKETSKNITHWKQKTRKKRRG